jgi:putative molybdopterin biosynthesis protein
MEMKADEVLKVPEVAEILRISRSRAYDLVARGEIPSFRVGEKSVRVHRRMLDEYMAQAPEAAAS